MKILCTGISGVGKPEHIEKVIQFSEERGKKVFYRSVGDVVQEKIKKSRIYSKHENILNRETDFLALAAGWALESIASEIRDGKHQNAIISTHAGFLWEETWQDSSNSYHIDNIDPDVFVTLIDDTERIKNILTKNRQWKHQNLTIKDLLLWQDKEVETTNKWAKERYKDHLVIARDQPPETMYKLLFGPKDLLKVYASYPMTHLQDEESKQQIRTWIDFMREYALVLDPGCVDIGKAPSRIVEKHTVKRDLQYLIESVDMTIAFYPKAVSSAGVERELIHTKKGSRDVILIYPSTDLSPFKLDPVTIEHFTDIEKFYDYMKKAYKPLKI
ncbi:AAA family ATPase [Candidatus Woesearchaeota archaeon]|nr:AAA family ATPase [Candidatus Woesearchaeota archaeon]